MTKALAIVLSTLIFTTLLTGCVRNQNTAPNGVGYSNGTYNPNDVNYQNMMREQDQRAEDAAELDAAHGHGGGHR